MCPGCTENAFTCYNGGKYHVCKLYKMLYLSKKIGSNVYVTNYTKRTVHSINKHCRSTRTSSDTVAVITYRLSMVLVCT